jgi:hypothetical protein
MRTGIRPGLPSLKRIRGHLDGPAGRAGVALLMAPWTANVRNYFSSLCGPASTPRLTILFRENCLGRPRCACQTAVSINRRAAAVLRSVLRSGRSAGDGGSIDRGVNQAEGRSGREGSSIGNFGTLYGALLCNYRLLDPRGGFFQGRKKVGRGPASRGFLYVHHIKYSYKIRSSIHRWRNCASRMPSTGAGKCR